LKRLLRTILVYGVAGVVAAYAVAVGGPVVEARIRVQLARNEYDRAEFRAVSEGGDELVLVVRSAWVWSSVNTLRWRTRPDMIPRGSPPPWVDLSLLRQQLMSSTQEYPLPNVMWWGGGWPVNATYAYVVDDEWTGAFLSRWALPARPYWPGMALNAGIYGVMLLIAARALSAAAGTVKRIFRRSRGSCVACGYDLRGSPASTCSECGHS
jgi:hypothetical protein